MTEQHRSPYDEFVGFAHGLADASGEVIRPYFRAPLDVTNKAASGFDPVTEADKAAERVIAEAVAARWPDHGFVGEEYGTTRPGARLRWVVDPIDGTRAFIMGWPMWGTLIGLLDGATPVLGMMDQPFTRERYWSAGTLSYMRGRGRGAATASRPARAPSSPRRSCRRRIPIFSTTAPKRRTSRG